MIMTDEDKMDAKLFRFLITEMQTNRNMMWNTLTWAQTINERREAIITLMNLKEAFSETNDEQL